MHCFCILSVLLIVIIIKNYDEKCSRLTAVPVDKSDLAGDDSIGLVCCNEISLIILKKKSKFSTY